MILDRLEKRVRENKKIFNFLYPFKNLFIKKRRIHYAQFGEDIVIENFFKKLGKESIYYFDIGANDPKVFSNTYLIYKKHEGVGLLVEPDSVLCKKLRLKRKRDVCVNVGIGSKRGVLDFYIFDCDPLNTFSSVEADKINKAGVYHLKKTDKVDVISFMDLVNDFSHGRVPDLVSLDAEGVEMDILKSIDFSVIRPTMFCIETLEYDAGPSPLKRQDIIDYMLSQEYYIYADTHLNTIFVDQRM